LIDKGIRGKRIPQHANEKALAGEPLASALL
jgi:hypothetical protein